MDPIQSQQFRSFKTFLQTQTQPESFGSVGRSSGAESSLGQNLGKILVYLGGSWKVNGAFNQKVV